jgi:hypothetical protein
MSVKFIQAHTGATPRYIRDWSSHNCTFKYTLNNYKVVYYNTFVLFILTLLTSCLRHPPPHTHTHTHTHLNVSKRNIPHQRSVRTIPRVSTIIYCLCDNSISPYAISGLRDLLQVFYPLPAIFVSSLRPSRAPTWSGKMRTTWWPHRPGVLTKTSTRYEEVVFARGGRKHEGGS